MFVAKRFTLLFPEGEFAHQDILPVDTIGQKLIMVIVIGKICDASASFIWFKWNLFFLAQLNEGKTCRQKIWKSVAYVAQFIADTCICRFLNVSNLNFVTDSDQHSRMKLALEEAMKELAAGKESVKVLNNLLTIGDLIYDYRSTRTLRYQL